MRCLLSAATLLLCLTVPAMAQHGGGTHGGNGLGAARGAVPHTGYAPRPFAPVVSGPPGLPIAPSFGSAPPWIPFVGNLGTTLRPNSFGTPNLTTGGFYGGYGQAATLPGLAAAQQAGRRGRERGYGAGAFLSPAIIIPGFVDPALAGFDVSSDTYSPLYADPSLANTQAYAGQPYPVYGQAGNAGVPAYGVAPQGYPVQGYAQPYPPQPYGTQPYGGYEPATPPQAPAVSAAPPREQDALTLYFLDGRPPEQVRNYALTRSSLLLTGDRMREIPLSDIDLATTQQVNRAAGIDFRLPN
jgi:hypothetical protein